MSCLSGVVEIHSSACFCMLYTYLSVSLSDVKVLMYFSSISVVNIACFFISDALNWSGLQNEGFSGQICEASDGD